MKSVTEVNCQYSGVLKESGTSGISIFEKVMYELSNVQFNLENVFKNKQE